MKERKSVLGRVGATLAGLLLAGAATAEDTPSGADDATLVEEIVVTANKRSQSIQDVAGSLSALGAEDLDAKGIKDMYDIQFAVPSLHFGQFLGTGSLAIRGIGEFARQPGVAVSLDGIYQGRSNSAQLYQLDLERVEVCAGPRVRSTGATRTAEWSTSSRPRHPGGGRDAARRLRRVRRDQDTGRLQRADR